MNISRQRRWQLKQMELGNCIVCGKSAVNSSLGRLTLFCQSHLESHRKAKREAYRLKQKAKGLTVNQYRED